MGLNLEPIDDQASDGKPSLDPIAALRRRREKLATQDTQDFDVPGYGGHLVVRYKRLGLEDYRESLLASAPTELERNAEFLIRACVEFFHRDADGELHPLEPGHTTRYNELEEILGVENATVRENVMDLFAGNELKLAEHSEQVERWMRSINEDADEEFVGGH